MSITPEEDRIAVTPQGLVARLKIDKFAEAGGFVARCGVLRLSAQGETEAEAEAALDEAIQVFLSDIAESGDLDMVLTAELGWKRLPASSDWRQAFVPPQVRSQTVNIGPIAVPA